MAGQDLSLRVQSLSPFNFDVKLFYTGDDSNFIIPFKSPTGQNLTPDSSNISAINNQVVGWYSNDVGSNFSKIIKDIEIGPAEWGTNFPTAQAFQNPDGTVWVTSQLVGRGEGLPFAFNTNFTFEVKFLYNAVLYTHVTNVTAGMPIDRMFQLSAEGIRDALILGGINPAVAQLLGNASPLCLIVKYELNEITNTFLLRTYITTTNNFLGSPGAFQSIKIGAQAAKLFTTSQLPNNGYNVQVDGWTQYVIVSERGGDDLSYRSVVNSIAQQSFNINEIYRYSNNNSQVNEPLEWRRFELTGEKDTIIETGLVDPYQPQGTTIDKANVVIDGNTYLQFTILAGEYIDLTFFYNTAGILNPEQIETLQKILRDENMDDMNESEEKELNQIYRQGTKNITEKYSNFSGDVLTDNKTKVFIGILLLLLIFRGNVGKE